MPKTQEMVITGDNALNIKNFDSCISQSAGSARWKDDMTQICFMASFLFAECIYSINVQPRCLGPKRHTVFTKSSLLHKAENCQEETDLQRLVCECVPEAECELLVMTEYICQVLFFYLSQVVIALNSCLARHTKH